MKKFGSVLLLCWTGLVHAQAFVYVNEDSLYDEDPTKANTVSAYAIEADGSLTPIAGSPFFAHTGHWGCWDGFPATNRITTAGDFLYAANCQSWSISGFAVNPATGVLTLIGDTPTLLVEPAGPAALGISLAATPDGEYLFATADTDELLVGRIHAFSVGATGELTEVAGSPLLVNCPSIAGIKVSPNGSYLAVTCPVQDAIHMFSIGGGGALTAVAGSPFAAAAFPTGVPMGLDINCASDLLFAGLATGGNAAIAVFDLGADGSLSPILGSPFVPAGGGLNSQVVLLNPDDDLLFVSSHGDPGGLIDGEAISVFTVAPDGTPGSVAGSPFPLVDYFFPSGLAMDPSGSYLYTTSWNPLAPGFGFGYAYGFSVGAGGALATVPGALGNLEDGLPQALTVYPPKSCGAPPETVALAIDIKFCSDPNGFNCRAKGVLPVTIFGTEDLDIAEIDVSSLRLCLASDPDQCTGAPVSSSTSDRGDPDEDIGAAMCALVDGVQQRYRTQDGLADLDIAFDNREVAELIGCGDLEKGDGSPTLILTGETTDGDSLGSIPVNDLGIDQLLIQKK